MDKDILKISDRIEEQKILKPVYQSLLKQTRKKPPTDLPAIRKAKLYRPTPQVLIEAIIVEANKDVARELGIQWGGIYAGKSGDKRAIVTGTDPNRGEYPSGRRSRRCDLGCGNRSAGLEAGRV